MSDEKLPQEVDVVVMGTGLPEAILAAACSRSGLSVLHLDRNDYYGAEWASFNMTSIKEWVDSQRAPETTCDFSSISELINEADGESFEELGDRKIVQDVEMGWVQENGSFIDDDSNVDEDLKKSFRRFSIDILPKVLLSRGAMVQTLCDSQVSRYAEFKLVDRQLCPVTVSEDGGNKSTQLNRVPCSKGEIFTSPVLSMMEKRLLMKFITFCTQWQTKTDEEARQMIEEHADQPFESFLDSMGVSGPLQSYIVNAIGILEPKPTTIKGLRAVCQFMDSVGQFGPSPFLFPLYGCGELAQCFCRLSAVFGSLYCLGRPVQAMVRKNGRIVAVIADGQRVNCQHIIMSPRFVTNSTAASTFSETRIDRHIYVTDKSLMADEKESITLLNAASLRQEASISRIIEAGFEACTAPKGYYLVHATGTREADKTIRETVEELFSNSEVRPLWHLSYSMATSSSNTCEDEQKAEHLPDNVVVAPSVDAFIDYGYVIEKCRQQFCSVWPDRDFLPRSIQTEDGDKDDDETAENEKTANDNGS